jgi:hypothetical protein
MTRDKPADDNDPGALERSLFEFTWTRPAPGHGYLPSDQKCRFPTEGSECRDIYERTLWSRDRVENPTPEPVLAWSGSGPTTEDYAPLSEERSLFRIFAGTDPTPEGCLEFANRYGVLGTRTYCGRGNLSCEPIAAWRLRVNWLRHLVRLWDLARVGDQGQLAQYLEWHAMKLVGQECEAVVLTNLPAERPRYRCGHPRFPSDPAATRYGLYDRADGEIVLSDVASQWRGHEETLPPVLSRGDLVRPALWCCHAFVSIELEMAGTKTRLAWDLGTHKPRMQIVPADLWAAILLQFALAIDGEKSHQQCLVCRRWFELSPSVNRADRLTCSASCRVRLVKRRRERTLQLRAEGKSVREIAKETGAKVENVKRWIQEQQDQQRKE